MNLKKISDMKLFHLHGDVIEVIGLVFRKWSSAALDYWFFVEKICVMQSLRTSRRQFCVKLVHFAHGCILNSSCYVYV